MGVPITFLDKYNPKQFEILGLDKEMCGHGFILNKIPLYVRIVIKRLNNICRIKILFVSLHVKQKKRQIILKNMEHQSIKGNLWVHSERYRKSGYRGLCWAGKTSTIVESLKLIPENKKILFIAFNKSIVSNCRIVLEIKAMWQLPLIRPWIQDA